MIHPDRKDHASAFSPRVALDAKLKQKGPAVRKLSSPSTPSDSLLSAFRLGHYRFSKSFRALICSFAGYFGPDAISIMQAIVAIQIKIGMARPPPEQRGTVKFVPSVEDP
jgi:hypothetical protein